MSVVIISANSFSKHEEIAEMVAQELGYKCIGQEIMAEASRRCNVSETKLKEALTDSSSFLDKLSNAKTRHLAYIQEAFLTVLEKDKIVYHGQTEHLLIEGVSHILKVRLLTDLEERVRLKIEKEQISEWKAYKSFLKESMATGKKPINVLGKDETDPTLFDLVVDVSNNGLDKSVRIISDMARDVKFQPITYSIKCMNDKVLECKIRASLIDSYPDVRVQAKDGNVSINSKALKKGKKDKSLSVKDQVEGMHNVNYVEVV